MLESVHLTLLRGILQAPKLTPKEMLILELWVVPFMEIIRKITLKENTLWSEVSLELREKLHFKRLGYHSLIWYQRTRSEIDFWGNWENEERWIYKQSEKENLVQNSERSRKDKSKSLKSKAN